MSACKEVEEAFTRLDKEKLSEIRVFPLVNSRKYLGNSSSVLSFLNILRKEGESGFCDVVLEVDGQSFPAHRCVLAANSQFFYTLFTSGMRDSNEKHVNLRSLGSSAVSTVLDFFYTRQIIVSKDNLEGLLEASSFLLLNHVKNACAEVMSHNLSISNCFSTKRLAERYALDELSRKAASFTTKNFQAASKQKEFLELNPYEVKELISSDSVRVEKEEEVFEAIVNWAKHDPTSRSKELSTLLPCLRYGSLSQEFLVNQFEQDSIFEGVSFCENFLKLQKRRQRRATTSEKQSMSRERPSATIQNVLIGVTRGHQYKSFCYDLQTEQFYKLPSPTSYAQLGVAAMGQELYTVGQESSWEANATRLAKLKLGTNNKSSVDRIWGKINNSSPLKPNACDRKTIVLSLKDKLYIVGGCMHHKDRSVDIQCFDPSQGEWKPMANMITPRCRIGAGATSNYIYAIGGKKSHGGPAESLVERYNPETNEWASMADVWFPRDAPHIITTNDNIFVIGGSYVKYLDETGLTRCGIHCAVYQESCNEWSSLPGIRAQDVFPKISLSVNDEVYTIVGGDCWKYFKKTDIWRKSKRFKALQRSAFQNSFNFVQLKLPKFCYDQYPKISANDVVFIDTSYYDDCSSDSSSSSSSFDEWYDYEDENEFYW